MKPLSREQQDLVCRHDWWIRDMVRHFAPDTAEELRAVARLKLVECAAKFDASRYPRASASDLDTIFAGYARLAVQRDLQRNRIRFAQRYRVWQPMSKVLEVEGYDGGELEIPDHRSSGREPCLVVWCSDDARRARRNVDIRARVLLYLHLVEGWHAADIGRAVGITTSRTSELLRRAKQTIAETRLRDQITRQLRQKTA